MKIQLAALSAVAALGTAAAVLAILKKNQAATPADQPAASAPKSAGKASKTAAPAPYVPVDPQPLSYSFISGFKDAATIDVTMTYDAAVCSGNIVEEGFLSATSDSHVAIIEAEDFSLQMEYVAYYSGESFETLQASVAENHSGFKGATYDNISGIQYDSGDNICFNLPADASSYLLVTVFKAKGSDVKLEEIPSLPVFLSLMNSICVSSDR